jgi:hypothetical protein
MNRQTTGDDRFSCVTSFQRDEPLSMRDVGEGLDATVTMGDQGGSC